MLFFQQPGRLLQKHVADGQKRLAVPLAEGLQLLQLAAKVEADLLQLDFKVHLERGLQIGQGKMPVGVLFHSRAQLRNGFAGQRKANGMCVSAKTGEELAAIGLLQCLQQMEARNRAAGAIRLPALSIVGQNQRRTSVALDYARGNNPNHAAVPVVAIEHQAVGLTLGGIAIQPLLYFFNDACLFVLPLGVELVQLGRNFLRLRHLANGEQGNDIVGDIHASGGVEAGSDAEGDIRGRGRASVAANRRHLEKRLQSRIHRLAQALETQLGQHAIFAGERHCVGNGGDGHHLDE